MKRILALVMTAVLTTAVFTGCTGNVNRPNGTAYYTFTDDRDNTVVLNEQPKRVVSLLGSYAETWLLAGGELAGVTEDVVSERNLQVASDTKIIGTVKKPNIEELLNLSPDLVLLSADLEAHVELSTTLQAANIPYAFFKVEFFEDYLRMLKICTEITGRADLYTENGLQVQAQIEDVLSGIGDPKDPPTVLFIRAMSSKAKALSRDNMTCKMLQDLHTDNIAARHESLLEDLSLETIISEDPDFIFVTTMGDTATALAALQSGIQSNPAWNSLSAVKNGHYVVLPKELFHYKPNAKWGESYEYLAKILYSK